MAYINTVKKNNATILLADGGDIGAGQVSQDLFSDASDPIQSLCQL